MKFPHDWAEMPEYPGSGEMFCTRCGVVKAFCGTETCSAEDYPPGPNIQPPRPADAREP